MRLNGLIENWLTDEAKMIAYTQKSNKNAIWRLLLVLAFSCLKLPRVSLGRISMGELDIQGLQRANIQTHDHPNDSIWKWTSSKSDGTVRLVDSRRLLDIQFLVVWVWLFSSTQSHYWFTTADQWGPLITSSPSFYFLSITALAASTRWQTDYMWYWDSAAERTR
jgi:hypothetical protein